MTNIISTLCTIKFKHPLSVCLKLSLHIPFSDTIRYWYFVVVVILDPLFSLSCPLGVGMLCGIASALPICLFK